MKILVTYSSLSGNTKLLAEAIYAALTSENKTILPIKEASNAENYDVILVGYWVDKGAPSQEAAEFLRKLCDKKIGIFATLGYWPDSDHAYEALKKGEDLVKDSNEVICRYICQGKLSDQIIEAFKSMPKDHFHALTDEKLRRYEIAARHPSKADIAVAGELFEERLQSICLKKE